MPQDKNMLRVRRNKWDGQKSWNILAKDITRQIQGVQFVDISEEDRAAREEAVRPVIRGCEEDEYGSREASEEGYGRLKPSTNSEVVPENT